MRVRFPDGTQVQGTFGADETVEDIYEFVREQLVDRNDQFQLRIQQARSQTYFVDLLPKGDLGDPTQTVRQAGFAARTLLMFTWNLPGRSKVLRDDVLRDAVDIEGVAKELLGHDEPQSKTKPKDHSNAASSDSGKKLPKWLGKFGKK